MKYQIVKDRGNFPLSNILDSLSSFSLGFERDFHFLNQMESSLLGIGSSYPPYNVMKESEESYKIELALPGFTKDELKISYKEGRLIVEGMKKSVDGGETSKYIYNGISTKSFSKSFTINDYVDIISSEFKDGVLSISLKVNIPENKRSRVIEIS